MGNWKVSRPDGVWEIHDHTGRRVAKFKDANIMAVHFAGALQENRQMRDELAFYRERCRQLQRIQRQFRDPERAWLCDILANGNIRGYDDSEVSDE